METQPHCDDRIVHAPMVCEYCDAAPERQWVRMMAGINFTGETDPTRLPCPADEARPPGSSSDRRRWGGNKPTSADDTWPKESFASQIMYGHPVPSIEWNFVPTEWVPAGTAYLADFPGGIKTLYVGVTPKPKRRWWQTQARADRLYEKSTDFTPTKLMARFTKK